MGGRSIGMGWTSLNYSSTVIHLSVYSIPGRWDGHWAPRRERKRWWDGRALPCPRPEHTVGKYWLICCSNWFAFIAEPSDRTRLHRQHRKHESSRFTRFRIIAIGRRMTSNFQVIEIRKNPLVLQLVGRIHRWSLHWKFPAEGECESERCTHQQRMLSEERSKIKLDNCNCIHYLDTQYLSRYIECKWKILHSGPRAPNIYALCLIDD